MIASMSPVGKTNGEKKKFENKHKKILSYILSYRSNSILTTHIDQLGVGVI
jgi:hypothetical protein